MDVEVSARLEHSSLLSTRPAGGGSREYVSTGRSALETRAFAIGACPAW